MIPWLTLYMDTCGNVGTVGQCRSCCMHTQCYIYSTHTGGQDKSRVHVHAPHTHTDDTPSTSAVHGCCYPGAQASKTRRIDHPHEPHPTPTETDPTRPDPCACRGSVVLVRSFAPPPDWSALWLACDTGHPRAPVCGCATV
jgi:hypothetical protein